MGSRPFVNSIKHQKVQRRQCLETLFGQVYALYMIDVKPQGSRSYPESPTSAHATDLGRTSSSACLTAIQQVMRAFIRFRAQGVDGRPDKNDGNMQNKFQTLAVLATIALLARLTKQDQLSFEC